MSSLAQHALPYLFLCLLGCARVGFGYATAADAAALADVSVVAAPADALVSQRDQLAPRDEGARGADLRADPFAPFGQAQPVAELNTTGAEDDPCLSGDMLEIFFDRDGDLFTATRSALTASWPTPTPVAAVNTDGPESSPELSADGRTLYFSRDSATSVSNVWRTTRASPGDPWATPSPVDELNSSSDDWFSAITADDLHAFVVSRRSGTLGGDDIFESSRTTASDPWGALVPAPGLNTAGAETSAWCNADGTIVYFESARGSSSRNIWAARRSALTEAFDTPVMVQGVSTSADEHDPWLSPDLRTIYFSRDVGGNRELFVATR